MRPKELARGAPDEGDALRRAERLFDAAAHAGLELSELPEAAEHVTRIACQSAPYLATLLAVAGLVGKVRAPAAEGIPYKKS